MCEQSELWPLSCPNTHQLRDRGSPDTQDNKAEGQLQPGGGSCPPAGIARSLLVTSQ